MALNEQEKQILQRGLELGKSKEETKRAISNYRAEQQQIETDRGNLGTGFTPTREFTGEENVAEFAETTAVNAPRSASQFGRNFLTAISNPIETGKNIFNLVQGAAGKGAQAIAENTGFGQRFLETAQQSRQERGVEALPTDEQGNIQAPNTEDMQMAEQAGRMLEERYGGIENFKETVAEDPVGVLADFAGIVSGTGLAARGAGLTGTARRLTQAGQALEPITAVSRGVTGAGRAVGRATQTARDVGRGIAGQILPSKAGQISKALDLTPNDIRNVSQKTRRSPGEIADFLLDRKIQGDTADILNKLEDTWKESRSQVKDAISGVDTTFSKNQIPNLDRGMEILSNLYDDAPALQDKVDEINNILGKDEVKLTDVQRAKELIDESDLIFKQSGGEKAGVRAEELGEIRRNMRSFIEDNAPDNVNVAELNRDTQTARELQNMVESRATRDLTRQKINAFDWMIGGGLGGAAAGGLMSFPAAAGLFITRKAMQTPAFRLSLARTLEKMDNSRITNIIRKARQGEFTPELTDEVRGIIDEAKRNSGVTFPVIETVEEVSEQGEE